MIKPTSTGVEIAIRVVPRARKTEPAGTRAGALVVRLAAAPHEGAANTALLAWLSRSVGVPARAVRIVAGERSRHKRVVIEGATIEQIDGWLKSSLKSEGQGRKGEG